MSYIYNIYSAGGPRVFRVFFIIPSIISTGVCVRGTYNGARVLSTITRTARGCGSCLRDGPAAGQSRARTAYYICEHIARVSQQRVCVIVGAYGERGKRIIWRGGGGNFLRVGRCRRHGPVFLIWWWSPPQRVIDLIIFISYVLCLYAHAITTKQSSSAYRIYDLSLKYYTNCYLRTKL